MSIPERIVVVGGGLAGVSAAGELRARGFEGEITLVDGGPTPYDRPPLSKAFMFGTADESDLALAKPDWYAVQRITLRTGSPVTALKPDEGVVELADGTRLDADVTILTTGAGARPLPVPGGDLPQVHLLRTIDDARALKARLVPGARLVVIGAGLIGAETASAALQLGAQVTLVDPIDPPIVPAVGPELARYLHDQHAEHGIAVHTAGVSEIRQTGDTVTVVLTTGEELPADAVLVGIGSIPSTELAEAAGLEVDGGVLVDEHFRTSHPAVFAAGDVARRRDSDGTLHRREEHWEAAQLNGRAVAARVLGQEPDPECAGWFWSDRHGIHVQGVGSMTAEGETVIRLHPDDATRPQMVFRVRGNTLVGAAFIDGGPAVRAARIIIDRALPVDPAALADPSVNLRKLAKG
ncbi:oxidoreductase [Prescottella equi]|uniref:NAD(P)/FAD-dependent oxidoreductase n=1 Tax=Rhodococcus hoagii TaxID=43767 RepID=UPI0007CD4F1A|nr:FAD-dependent oxidoreductase [Prescottella equi]MCD7050965.1 FAD-dependent oxidoreductase [Rhodococcus sp. BH2-1]MBM4485802.1 oxidoreductase [Prescottella equi]MBM4533323.1 oxidoreductase [Prescottella equi]NKR79164.1 oxidoreductase [Prescottella equi]NKR84033.1 oxidoreductase [Prescottella equi]